MLSSLTVADYLLAKTEQESFSLTPMQIIKLVYLCHGWMLGLHGRPLIADDVEAWRYGPVIRELYGAVRKFRSNPVVGPLSQNPGTFDEEEKDIMNQVFNIYGKYTGMDLSRLTHASGSPWRITFDAGEKTISNDLIEDHFRQLSKRQ